MAQVSDLVRLPRMTITVHLVNAIGAVSSRVVPGLELGQFGVVANIEADASTTKHFFVPWSNIKAIEFSQTNE